MKAIDSVWDGDELLAVLPQLVVDVVADEDGLALSGDNVPKLFYGRNRRMATIS